MARPAHQPDPALRRQVEAMAGYGIPEADISGMIGIDAKSLRKHYRHELDYGHTKANAKVAENLYRKATGEGRELVTRRADTMNLKDRLCDIQSDRNCWFHGSPPSSSAHTG